jgi:hypothetical protein
MSSSKHLSTCLDADSSRVKIEVTIEIWGNKCICIGYADRMKYNAET